jgi:hypothetical protein
MKKLANNYMHSNSKKRRGFRGASHTAFFLPVM